VTTTVIVQNHGPKDVLVKTKDGTGTSAYPDETVPPGKFVSRHVYDVRSVEVSEVKD
jgi:hypothetical protein